jgi:hypothetical protein
MARYFVTQGELPRDALYLHDAHIADYEGTMISCSWRSRTYRSSSSADRSDPQNASDGMV